SPSSTPAGCARASSRRPSAAGTARSSSVPRRPAGREVSEDSPVTTGTKRPRPPAMHDVARVAGVSHQTVSRVLNDHPNVRAATRERVLAAIAELGYRRNSAARALVTRRSGILGVVTLSSSEYGPTSTIIALESAAY